MYMLKFLLWQYLINQKEKTMEYFEELDYLDVLDYLEHMEDADDDF